MRLFLAAFTFLLLTLPAPAADCFLVDNTNAIRERINNIDACPSAPQGKVGWRWLPYSVVKPSFVDPETEVLSGPVRSIGASAVTDTWTKTAMTAAQLDAVKSSKIDGMDVAIFLALCHLKNEVRTKVDNLAAWTTAQCKTAFKALLP